MVIYENSGDRLVFLSPRTGRRYAVKCDGDGEQEVVSVTRVVVPRPGEVGDAEAIFGDDYP